MANSNYGLDYLPAVKEEKMVVTKLLPNHSASNFLFEKQITD